MADRDVIAFIDNINATLCQMDANRVPDDDPERQRLKTLLRNLQLRVADQRAQWGLMGRAKGQGTRVRCKEGRQEHCWSIALLSLRRGRRFFGITVCFVHGYQRCDIAVCRNQAESNSQGQVAILSLAPG